MPGRYAVSAPMRRSRPSSPKRRAAAMTKAMEEARAIAQRLSDYNLTLDPNVVFCDRRVVDEAVAALAARDAEIERLREASAVVDNYEGKNALIRDLTDALSAADALTAGEREPVAWAIAWQTNYTYPDW